MYFESDFCAASELFLILIPYKLNRLHNTEKH